MKKLILAGAAALALAGGAQAQTTANDHHFVPLTIDHGMLVELDYDDIAQSPDGSALFVAQRVSSPKGGVPMFIYSAVDCGKRRLKVFAIGVGTKPHVDTPSAWKYAEPGTLVGKIVSAVCDDD